MAPHPFKLVQTKGLVVLLYEALSTFRQIHTDGRALPHAPNPAWMGYSIGNWEGDTLVVRTTGFNDKTWLDIAGHPNTDALQVIERFRRRDFGHMDLEITIDDAKAYTQPWTVTIPARSFPTPSCSSSCAMRTKKTSRTWLENDWPSLGRVSFCVAAPYPPQRPYPFVQGLIARSTL